MKRTGMRHARLVIVLAAVVAATVATRDARAAEPRLAPKPNVLFIAIDDLRDWVGYLGNNRRSRRPISTGSPRAAWRSRAATAPRRAAIRRARRCCRACGPAPPASTTTATTGAMIPAEAHRRCRCTSRTTATTSPARARSTTAAVRRLSDWDDYLTEGGAERRRRPDGQAQGKARSSRATRPRRRRRHPLRPARLRRPGHGGLPVGQLLPQAAQTRSTTSRSSSPAACTSRTCPGTVPKKYYDMYPLDKIQLPQCWRTTSTTCRPPACRWPSPRATTPPSSSPAAGRTPCRPISPRSPSATRWSAG